MRFIAKSEEPPASIREFIEIQMEQETPVNLDYEGGFSQRKKQLLAELTDDQFSLCAYTGMPIDHERLKSYNNDDLQERGALYRAHNEHIKAQSTCKTEAGERWGVEPCEDIDHCNIVAAIEVSGVESEQFGAVARRDIEIPLPPTNPKCEVEFKYNNNGIVSGVSEPAADTITLLKLDHKSLEGYRKSWISVFLSLDSWKTREDLTSIIETIEQPRDKLLVKFSFCIASAAKQILQVLDSSEP